MKRVASSDQELTIEERNLLSVAYKNVIGASFHRAKGSNEAQVSMSNGYREKIELDLAKICEDKGQAPYSLCRLRQVEGVLSQDVSSRVSSLSLLTYFSF
jgi:hypothetical protein